MSGELYVEDCRQLSVKRTFSRRGGGRESPGRGTRLEMPEKKNLAQYS